MEYTLLATCAAAAAVRPFAQGHDSPKGLRRCPSFIQTRHPLAPARADSGAPSGRRSQDQRPALAALGEPAVEAEDLDAAARRKLDPGIRGPFLDTHQLALILVDHPPDGTGTPNQRRHAGRRGIDHHMPVVIGCELAQLDEDRAPRFATRRGASPGVADICAGGRVTVFVLKHTIEHQKLLAAVMGVGRETASGGVAHDGGRAGDFVADPVEHETFHPRHRRGHEILHGGMDDGAAGEIGVELHAAALCAEGVGGVRLASGTR